MLSLTALALALLALGARGGAPEEECPQRHEDEDSTMLSLQRIQGNRSGEGQESGARPVVDRGCYTIGDRKECCRSVDGRYGTPYGGQPCVPAAEGRRFTSGNVCEPICFTQAQYVKINSGTCSSSGHLPIADGETCTAAAAAMGFHITWGPHGGYDDVIEGCSVRSGTHLFIQPVGGDCTEGNILGSCSCGSMQTCICEVSTGSCGGHHEASEVIGSCEECQLPKAFSGNELLPCGDDLIADLGRNSDPLMLLTPSQTAMDKFMKELEDTPGEKELDYAVEISFELLSNTPIAPLTGVLSVFWGIENDDRKEKEMIVKLKKQMTQFVTDKLFEERQRQLTGKIKDTLKLLARCCAESRNIMTFLHSEEEDLAKLRSNVFGQCVDDPTSTACKSWQENMGAVGLVYATLYTQLHMAMWQELGIRPGGDEGHAKQRMKSIGKENGKLLVDHLNAFKSYRASLVKKPNLAYHSSHGSYGGGFTKYVWEAGKDDQLGTTYTGTGCPVVGSACQLSCSGRNCGEGGDGCQYKDSAATCRQEYVSTIEESLMTLIGNSIVRLCASVSCES